LSRTYYLNSPDPSQEAGLLSSELTHSLLLRSNFPLGEEGKGD